MIRPAEHQGLLRRLTRLTRNADTAEDCLQSAFVRLEEYRRHTPVHNTVGFLAQAARNIAIDEARKSQVRAASGCFSELLENYRDDQPLQDEVLMARERLSRARAVLTQLPERTRTAFLMHRFSRAKYSEIAVHLGVSVSAVEKHIARASLALANSFDQENSAGKADRRARDIAAEAAAWLARLHSDGRDARDEAAFQAWLADHPAHRDAFARATDAWELAGGLEAEFGGLVENNAGRSPPPGAVTDGENV